MCNSPIEGYLLLTGPTRLTSRIFVANLPECSRNELAQLCARFGNILGTMIKDNYGYVQFESKRQASIAILALHRSRFKGKTLTVHSATFHSMEAHGRGCRQAEKDELVVAEADSSGRDLIADCVIIVMDLEQVHSAMRIRDRLFAGGLSTEVRSPLALDDQEPLTSLLELAGLGTQYAMVLTSTNGRLDKAAVHFLYEDRSEHPDLTVDQAIEVVAKDYNRRHVCNPVGAVRD
ncbi:uncharacterized protein LOC108024082 [Drosophila biarmipes]|uniref:uncharacterized protein LOC108024082 n=1 Tax=Drosophila biarmipes TaxID=125945 RepID=UPI0007E78BEF|nr:uncharacterized protein LOC108024082 [Drosophila biarmipes]